MKHQFCECIYIRLNGIEFSRRRETNIMHAYFQEFIMIYVSLVSRSIHCNKIRMLQSKLYVTLKDLLGKSLTIFLTGCPRSFA